MLKTQNLQKTLDIQSILNGCIVGNRNYQKLLYNNYAPTMFAICLRYANNYHSAEDILQEGFIKVFRRLNSYRGHGSFEGWMKRIFINTAIEHFRKSKKHRCLKLEDDFQSGIEAKAVQALVKDDLIKLVQSLSIGYRSVFNLYVIDGYNHREIAELLSISEGTSKSQLARARNILKKRIIELDGSR